MHRDAAYSHCLPLPLSSPCHSHIQHAAPPAARFGAHVRISQKYGEKIAMNSHIAHRFYFYWSESSTTWRVL